MAAITANELAARPAPLISRLRPGFAGAVSHTGAVGRSSRRSATGRANNAAPRADTDSGDSGTMTGTCNQRCRTSRTSGIRAPPPMTTIACTCRSDRMMTSRVMRADDSTASVTRASKLSRVSRTRPPLDGIATAVLSESCSFASLHRTSRAANSTGDCGASVRPDAICCSRIKESK